MTSLIKNIIKKTVIILVILIPLYFSAVYFAVKYISNNVNSNFAQKNLEFDIAQIGKHKLFFERFESKSWFNGFEFELHGVKEKNKLGNIKYIDPVIVKFSPFSNNLSLNYSGKTEIISNNNDMIIGEIDDYFININVKMFKLLTNSISNKIAAINYIDDIEQYTKSAKFSSKKTALSFVKNNEQINFWFDSDVYYKSIEDIKKNLPSKIYIDYQANNKSNKNSGKIFFSLIYPNIFCDKTINLKIKNIFNTNASSLDYFVKNINMDSKVDVVSDTINLTDFKLNFIQNSDADSYEAKLSGKIRTHNNSVLRLINLYNQYVRKYASYKINKQIDYLKNNYHSMNLQNLNNNIFNMSFDGKILEKGVNSYNILVKEFSLTNKDKQGFKSVGNNEITIMGDKYNIKGGGVIGNYPAFVDFTSNYIHQFINLKRLDKSLRKLYIKTTNDLIKEINLNSRDSNDFKLKYDINSKDLDNSIVNNYYISVLKKKYLKLIEHNVKNIIGININLLRNIPGINQIPLLKERSEIDNLINKIAPEGEKVKDKLKGIEKLLPKKLNDNLKKLINLPL